MVGHASSVQRLCAEVPKTISRWRWAGLRFGISVIRSRTALHRTPSARPQIPCAPLRLRSAIIRPCIRRTEHLGRFHSTSSKKHCILRNLAGACWDLLSARSGPIHDSRQDHSKSRQLVLSLILLARSELLFQKLFGQVLATDTESDGQSEHNGSKHGRERDQDRLLRNSQHLKCHG